MSKKYRIAYIDEEQKEIDDFLSYFDEYADEIDIIPIHPNNKATDEIVDEIIEQKCDLVIIDFYLKYAESNVEVNGDELLLRVKDRQLNLPLLIFTSRVEEAQDSFVSPETLICSKKEINDPENSSFKDKVVSHIEFYKKLKKRYQEEYSKLRLKQDSGEKLTGKEKKRVIELNHILEEMSDRQRLVTPIENQDQELTEINALVDKTEELIQKLSKEGDV
ncbi:hypothetical protein [Aquimarina sp. 2201CG14-23]|uniref:hypothetical protein n=1 Tax=Aquimarina mycalae TaxID=3040073 RepID=UPI002477DB8D|nr:hypothetical protein [Aquimarina sp. 2201CG14-23]MDH7448032.1 hypothetical protein [Aquimarina sp. 2201CG14-23]